jgi:hypothetical protein
VPAVLGVVTLCDPLAARDPLQLPPAVQLVALTDVQVRVTEPLTVKLLSDVDSVGAPGGSSAMAASACTNPNPEVKL